MPGRWCPLKKGRGGVLWLVEQISKQEAEGSGKIQFIRQCQCEYCKIYKQPMAITFGGNDYGRATASKVASHQQWCLSNSVNVLLATLTRFKLTITHTPYMNAILTQLITHIAV